MVLDIAKGFTATNLAYFIGLSITGPKSSTLFVNYQLALGIVAVLGHLFPIFAGFRGGKGIATLFGMILAVHPGSALVCVGVFIPVLLFTRYVSLSSITAGFTFPLSMIFIFHSPIRSVVLYGMCICILVLVTHQKNIERLLRGKESRVNFFRSRK